jgi:hypothetical protein
MIDRAGCRFESPLTISGRRKVPELGMNTSAIDQLTERITRLEHENGRLSRRLNRGRGIGMTILVCLAVALVGVPGRPGILSAQERAGGNREPSRTPPPPPPSPIQLGVGTKVVEAEHYLLRDQVGNLLAVLAGNPDGSSTLSLHAKDQAVRLFLKVSSDGEPSLIFFDKTGKRPAEVFVARDGAAPSLKVVSREGQPLFGQPLPPR